MTTLSDSLIRDFHRLYYGRRLHTDTRYHGIEAHKCPLDLWVYQEILFDVQPALVIELGTYLGGTTLFLAHQLDVLGKGRLLSIDATDLARPHHDRITYLHGRTSDDFVLDVVRKAVDQAASAPVMVIHDADHHYEDVLEDLERYEPFVTIGSYLIVEDTNVNGHPVLEEWGEGPWEAVEAFLLAHPQFEKDHSRERFLITYNPGGYLRRTSKD